MPRRSCFRIAIVALVLGSGCTIERRIEAVPAMSIPSLCIAENPKVWDADFLPMLREELARHRIDTSTYDGAIPRGCSRHLEYTAHWDWDFALYLQYVDIRMYEGDTLIGSATYDASTGSARLDKFGSDEPRVAALVDDLLRNVNRSAEGPTAAGTR